MNNVVIIGGGFCGTMVAVNLVKRSMRPLNIVIVEKRSHVGEGLAYSTRNQEHLLNVRAKGMSAFPDEPLDFWEFVKARYLQYSEDSFVPRSIYGDYLKHTLNQSLLEARSKGVSLEIVSGEAVSLKQMNATYRIEFADGRFVDSDYVVLAVGNLARKRSGQFSSLGSSYISDPLSEGALDTVRSTDRVLFLGTGLTAIDKVVELLKRGHTGRLRMVSRHGLLPRKHTYKSKPIAFCPADTMPKTARETLRFVRELVSNTSDWRDAIDSLRPYSQLWWQKLDPKERSRFKRHLQTLWDVHRHRMAPSVAEIIDNAISSGQLQIVRGRFQGVRTDQFDKIIDCTGFSFDVSKLDSSLLKNMNDFGILSAHPSGDGIDIDEHGRMINASGKSIKRLFVLGPILRTQLFENVAVPELRVQALEMAQELLSRIQFQLLQQDPSISTVSLHSHVRSSSSFGTS